ncbi:MAG: sensor histidine kinase, partial [Bacteroidota bacterium]
SSEWGNTLTMPLLFKDVIRDLVSNARKYTPAGGTIHMRIRQNNGLLHVSIADNGIGIPEEELPRVFDYGYRASNAGGIRTMGGGFGLTKALHVVRLFNGDIRIESTPGKGTTITAELPLPENLRLNGT